MLCSSVITHCLTLTIYVFTLLTLIVFTKSVNCFCEINRNYTLYSDKIDFEPIKNIVNSLKKKKLVGTVNCK